MNERDTEAHKVATGNILGVSTKYNAARSRRRFRVAALLVILLVASGGYAVLSRTQEANWYLPADYQADPTSSRLTILVEEQGCTSGQAPRITKPQVQLTDSTVTIAVRTRERYALTQSCQEIPATPLEVNLGEPLGDRKLADPYDGLVVNIRAIGLRN